MSMIEPVYMSPRGRSALVARLRGLEAQLRGVTTSKGEAAEVGGNAWHDNFAFEQLCRDEQMLRWRIAELSSLLARAEAPPPRGRDQVGINCRVSLENDEGQEKCITVVGYGESDPASGTVEYAAPLGRALLGLEVGDDVTLPVPKLKGAWVIVAVAPAEPGV